MDVTSDSLQAAHPHATAPAESSVLGGMDSLGGAILAGIGLGVFEAVASGWLDPMLGGGTRDLVVATVLIVTIMVRPHGLFGRHDIERL